MRDVKNTTSVIKKRMVEYKIAKIVCVKVYKLNLVENRTYSFDTRQV